MTILKVACCVVTAGILFGAPATAGAAFSLEAFGGALSNPDGSDNYQAGAHTDLTTQVSFSKPAPDSNGLTPMDANTKDVRVDLPPGMVGNASAMPQCDAVALRGEGLFAVAKCPPETQIGTVDVEVIYGFPVPLPDWPVYNLAPPRGMAAQFAFNIFGVIVALNARVVSSPEYHVVTEVVDASQSDAIPSTIFHFWGVPADPVHDAKRFDFVNFGPPAVSTAPRLPFMTAPTSCGEPMTTTLKAVSWQEQDSPISASFDTDLDGDPMTMKGCNQLDFSPTLEARPTTNVADSPSGLDATVHVPQNEDPEGLAEAMLRDATVTLPAGMTVNPSSAQGLGACSPSQVGLTSAVGVADAKFDEAPVSCPSDSKLGTVQIDTPLIDHPLPGSIYLASPGENPFSSLLALYIAVEDPVSGITIKLAGHPVPDSQTGQLRVSFDQNPQLPFEDLHVNLFTGPRAALKTPLACGTFTTSSAMIPWTAPEGGTASPSDTFAITRGAGGGDCPKSDAEAPNKPSFQAGTTDPAAGAYAPFVLKLSRADGTQPIKGLDATLPKGLLGRLAGIPYCSDSALASAAGKSGKAEQASASCPSASQVGSVQVGAGAGSNPLYVDGKAYLAGPYKGAPLSLAIVTPAVAGPFDLGSVVVRTALQVNPETAQIHAVSDEIPTILQGIPLDIRSIAVSLDKPQFTLNPTSCNPTSVDGSALSVFGQSASLADRFQVGGCNGLGFKPRLKLTVSGATKRGKYPKLRAELRAPAGQANIGRVSVALPHSEFLAQEHIKTICTRVQFAARQCPAGSVYGYARAFTPLLEKPLEGPVYLRSSSNPLPDLVASLDGQIHVDLAGRIDSVNGGIRNTFEAVPDAPVSKFVLTMKGGKKGLLVNSRDLCATTNRATVRMDGQNGKTYDSRPVVGNSCGKKKAKKGHRGAKH